MRKFIRQEIPVCLLFASVLCLCGFSQTGAQQDTYPDPSRINRSLRVLQQANPSVASVSLLATSPGKNEVLLLEIGNEAASPEKTNPAILVVGNLEGDRPLASLASMKLAEMILDDPESYASRTWYIIPAGNPDAMYSYFSTPLFENTRNAAPRNDDLDEATDEDGYNDLNGDGLITRMRVRHPEGEWIPVESEPRLMRRADPKKGEQGIYKIYEEGVDLDGDGQYNEDGPGGTDVNINFPHLFEPFDPESGLYPGSAPEARAILKFACAHPEIAMTFAFGATNFCLTPPRGGRKGEVDLTRIRIPERYAEMFGADPGRSYSMEEVIEMVRAVVPEGVTVDEPMVAGFLGLGAVVNPLEEDLAFYNKLSGDYKKYLEDKGVKEDRFDPEKTGNGSFELWSYYQLGVPVFSMDLWSVPKPVREKEEAGTDDSGAGQADGPGSGQPDATGSGRPGPSQLASRERKGPEQQKDGQGADPEEKALLDYSDKVLGGKGFVSWEKFGHPTLGEVEIGGFVPFTATTPQYSITDSIFDLHLPWIFELVKNLPSLGIHETKVTEKGPGVYQLEVWVENASFLPFPTAMGRRNRQPAPAVVLLEGTGYTLLQGLARTPVGDLKGRERKKMTWLIRADKRTDIPVSLTSKSAGNDRTTVKIGG
jgi:hypothetical protein